MPQTIHVVPTIDNEASGPSYSVTRLCEALNARNCTTQLAVLEPLPASGHSGFVKAFPYGGLPKRLGYSPKMKHWLRRNAVSGDVDVFHNHSLWMFPNVYPSQTVKGTQCKLVVAPRGTMSPRAMQRTGLFKKIFSPLLLNPALKYVDAFHATSFQEYEDIRALGYNEPVAIIPNGVDLPVMRAGVSKSRRQLLFLGRIHPIKGIDNLLRAWVALQDKFLDWDLIVIGPDEGGYKAEMLQLAKELSAVRCFFKGPVYGVDKPRAYQEADLYVLPTHTENFGMTVAESLANGTPVITTKGAPWQGLEAKQAGWWIEVGVDPLVEALEFAMSQNSDTLAAKGINGREWMRSDFSWEAIAEDMHSFYQWLTADGPQPSSVQFS